MPAIALRHAFERLSCYLEADRRIDWRAQLLGPQDEQAEAQAFVAAVYRRHYNASLREFMPWLLTFRDDAGELCAVVGLRLAFDACLFVEQYLDQAAEQAVGAALSRAVDRAAMVEVGGLAARRPGDARRLILCLTHGLHGAGFRWVLFAATLQLRNTFDRLGLRTVALAPARPERLRPAATDWGRYYDGRPVLLCGDVAAGAHFLAGAAVHPRLPLRGRCLMAAADSL